MTNGKLITALSKLMEKYLDKNNIDKKQYALELKVLDKKKGRGSHLAFGANTEDMLEFTLKSLDTMTEILNSLTETEENMAFSKEAVVKMAGVLAKINIVNKD